MKKGWKNILRRGALVLAGLLFLLAAFSVFVYFHKPALKGYLERTLSKRTGLTVKIGRLDYRLFPLRVEANAVRIGFAGFLGRGEALISRASAPGSLRRVLKGQKPYIGALTLSGLKLEFDGNPQAPPAGMIDVIAAARALSESLRSVGRLIIRDAAFRLSLPVEGVEIEATGLDLTASREDRTTITLSAKTFDFQNARPGASVAAALLAGFSWESSNPSYIEAEIDLTAAALSLPESGWSGSFSKLGAGLRFDGRRVVATRLLAEIPGLVTFSGSGRFELGREAAFSFISKVEIEDIDRAKEAFAAFLPRNLPDFSIAGPAGWEGELRREAGSGGPGVFIDGALHLPPARWTMKRNGLSVDMTLRADLRVSGSQAALRIAGLAKGERGELAAKLFRIRGLSFDLPIKVDGSRFMFSSFQTRATELQLHVAEPGLKLEGFSVAGGLEIDLPRREVSIDSMDFEWPGIGRASLAGRASLVPRPSIALNMTCRDLDIRRLLGTFAVFVPESIAAWSPAGLADLSVEVKNGPSADRRFRVRGTVGVTGAAFQDAAGSIVSEGLEPRLAFDADLGTLGQPFPLSFRLDLAKGESLWKEVYLNWRDSPLRLDVKGECDVASRSLRSATAVLAFTPLGELRAEGSFSAGPKLLFQARFSAPSVDLARLRGFLGNAIPSKSAAWDIEGRAEAEADARFDGAFGIRGNIKVSDGSLKRRDNGLALAGVSAHIPFSISNGVRPAGERGDFVFAPGFIGIREIQASSLRPAPLRIDFFASRNIFLFLPFEIGLWGARLGTGHSVLVLSPEARTWNGASSLTLEGLDLAELPIASESLKLSGRAWIPHGGLEWGPDEVRFNGQVLAEVFGGRMALDGLRVTDPLSAGRRVMFQGAIAGLDLGRVTSAVSFGEVTGIVDVSLRDFILSYGQPEAFDLSVLSVPRKGVPRKFSLKAVDNLSVISSGGRATPPSASWLMKFVRSFHYSRIGIACSLRNDVFTLRGTIVQGGVQYLVRRSALFGIDVVNAKPVNTISFKDMISRLERVGGELREK